MCGIAGVINLGRSPVSPVAVAKMGASIAHRGPDSDGVFVSDEIGLAHRRLAIIDLSPAGHQPMITRDGRFVIVYNGEIYNFQSLRIELEALGFQFHSKTDTEVLLNAFAAWGAECLPKLNGMFAFAIWDTRERSLFLARDRYGIKPLYWALTGGSFLFASEAKAILAHPDLPAKVDQEALLEYFTFQNLFTEKTLFKGIQLLRPGYWLQISATDSRPKLRQYWDFSFEEPSNPATDDEYLEELDRLFIKAVSRQLISDVEVGSYLSGGLDSGSITAISAKQLNSLKTFTCGFDLNSASGLELSFDERSAAEYMSYLFKTEHYEMVLKAGDMERAMPKLAWHIEEPRVGQSYPNFYAARLASKFVKVVMSGSGGDELFGGYPWRYYRAVVNDDFDHYIDKYYSYWQRLVPNSALKRLFQPIWQNVSHVWTRDIFSDVFLKHAPSLTRPEDYVNHSLYFEAKTFLHGILVVEDKLSSAYGLETRVPFLDNDLVDFAMKVPARLKLGNLREVVRLNENDPGNKIEKYYNRTKDGKLLLRKMLERHIPAVVAQREKQGFSAPDASWFKGDSIDYVKHELLDGKAKIYDYLDRQSVCALVGDHLEGRENRRLFIWSLLSFEWWLRTFLK